VCLCNIIASAGKRSAAEKYRMFCSVCRTLALAERPLQIVPSLHLTSQLTVRVHPEVKPAVARLSLTLRLLEMARQSLDADALQVERLE
jgi:hypothetical protein